MSIQFLYTPGMMPTCDSILFRQDYGHYVFNNMINYNDRDIIGTNRIPTTLLYGFKTTDDFCINLTSHVVMFATRLIEKEVTSLMVVNKQSKDVYMFSLDREIFFTDKCPDNIIEIVKAFITVSFSKDDVFNYTVIPYKYVQEKTFNINIVSKDLISSYLVDVMRDKRLLRF